VLQLLGELQQVAASGFEAHHLVGMLLDDRRARIVVLVDAMTEAHQLDSGLLVLDLLHVLLDRDPGLLDRREHLNHSLIGAAV